jgi:HK97 family phage portal protein
LSYGTIKKLFSRSKPPAPHDDYWYIPRGATESTISGIKVDENTAVKYLTVYDCVSLVSGDVSNLPLILYRRMPGNNGKERAQDHPKYDLCHTAINEEITARGWIESGISHNMLWGNHYALKVFNKVGRLIELWPFMNPGSIEPYRSKKDNRIHYKYRLQSGEIQDKTRDEILHIPGWGFNGLVGLSPITIAREAIGLGLATEEFGQRFFGSGTHPAGILSMPPEAQRMQEDVSKQYLAAIKDQITGLGKSHSILMTRNGEKYTPLTMPLNDAQFLESRQFQKLEIAGMYHVPPHKIAIHGANSNYNNEEQENRHYVDSCLLSWLRRWETCLNQQILTKKERLDGYFYEFLVDGLLRGDSEARVAYYIGMKNIGAITNNEIRAKENMNPLPDDQRGDETTMPLNFIFVKDAEIIPDNGMGKENKPVKEEEDERKWAERTLDSIEYRSIITRDRIAKNFRPLILESAQQVVNRETRAIKAQVQNLRKLREKPDLDAWMEEYYQGLAEYIRKKLGPTMRSFAQAIIDATVYELGGKEFDPAEVDLFIEDYINVYVTRHIASSQGQIKALNDLDEIDARMDEWQEKRADKIANNETVRLSNGAFQAVVFAAGFVTVFRIRGPSTCPYCRSLEGMRVSAGQYLVEDGDELLPSNQQEPMKINGSKAHPPIHQGCDCYMAIG